MTIEICDCCGAKLVKYRHRLNKLLLSALTRIYEKNKTEPFHLGEQGLTHSQRDNFQKMRYWQLVEKWQNEEGDRKGGYWKITSTGELFIKGQISIAPIVWTFRAKFVSAEGAQVYIKEVFEGYEYRGDYIDNARPFGRFEQ